MSFPETEHSRHLAAIGNSAIRGVKHAVGSYLYDFGPVMFSQPRCQFAVVLVQIRMPEQSLGIRAIGSLPVSILTAIEDFQELFGGENRSSSH
jgi:hypothetical protein